MGTKTLAAGAVLDHGDIPQETREVVEGLIRQGAVKLVICTNTLAEGVNLPIRTPALDGVQRRRKAGPPQNLLIRDIKNLVGRAGRAGVTTKGLVICANEHQWPLVSKSPSRLPANPSQVLCAGSWITSERPSPNKTFCSPTRCSRRRRSFTP